MKIDIDTNILCKRYVEKNCSKNKTQGFKKHWDTSKIDIEANILCKQYVVTEEILKWNYIEQKEKNEKHVNCSNWKRIGEIIGKSQMQYTTE